MKKCTTILVFLFTINFLSQINAQQLPLFTQYREMQGIVNPAAISRDFIKLKHNLLIGTSYRRQWIEAPEAPATLMLQVEWLKEKGNTHLITGLSIIEDKVGKESTTGINNRIGILISDNPQDHGFGLALNAGVVNYRVRLGETTSRDFNDPNIGANRQKWHPDIGVGIFGYTKVGNDNLIYGGLSAPQVFGLKAVQLNDNQDIIRYRHLYLMGGYIIPLNDENSSIEFSSWTKFVPNVKPNIDLNLRYNYKDQLQIGIGYNMNNNLLLEASYTLCSNRNFDITGLWRIGYSHNINYSSFANAYGASHEFHLSVAFGGN
jgi:type IX secretion system PorP/SprF family membrane protein